MRLCFEEFFRVLFECHLASGSAEVVGFSLVNSLMLRLFLVHLHFTNWVNRQVFHLPFIVGLNLFSNDALVTTDTELKAIAAAAKTGSSKTPMNGYRIPAATGIRTVL
jgi:hypothetical protein